MNRKKDGVDIDMFAEYEKITKKILEEEPSKLTVYLDLDDVKASAKVSCSRYLFIVNIYLDLLAT